MLSSSQSLSRVSIRNYKDFYDSCLDLFRDSFMSKDIRAKYFVESSQEMEIKLKSGVKDSYVMFSSANVDKEENFHLGYV